jgi:hypothetical protein
LPIGFQEGIAQYMERDTDQRRRFAATIRQGMDAGQLLHFADLNRSRPFLARARLAYPESYSMVVYLAGRYGFGQVIHLVEATRDADTLDAAATAVLGRSMADLEQEWLAFLPSFLDQDWARNDLDLWDLAIPQQQLAVGQYAAARENLERAERLFTNVGRDDRAAEARADRDRAQTGIEATDLTRDGTAALSVYDYDSAATLLGQAEQRWRDVGDAQRSALAGEAATQARDGQAATAQLDDARRQLDGWHFQEADEQAFAAGQALSDLGDAPRTEEARQVMVDAQQLRTRLGLAAVGSGAVGVTGLGAAWLFGRRRRRPHTPPLPRPHAGEGEQHLPLPLGEGWGEGADDVSPAVPNGVGPRQDWSL